MCGIAGFVGKSASYEALDAVARRMADQLARRGPDDLGVWTDQEAGVGLGHRRLAVLDLSIAGSQPMMSPCARFVITFNGEIYNHFDLRRSLGAVSAAPEWRGYSDTETLLAAITCWGLDEALKRASGMFALALWDRRDRELSLARDRIGEKPLYWGWAGSALVFGSELKALRAHPNFTGGVDRGALAQYLRFAYVPAPRSIHPGIYKLEPGTILKVAGQPPQVPPAAPIRPGEKYQDLSIRRYWFLNEVIEAGARDPITEEAQALEALEQSLSTAVSRQLISDVPLGAFLSGGVDSSTIVALMQAQSNGPIKSFTIGFEDGNFDESPYAEAVARHLGTDHVTLGVTEAETQAVIPELPVLYDEPFADSSQIPTHAVCRAARTRVTVALSGDAGDELFGGYNRYVFGPQLWDRIGWMPAGLRRSLASIIRAMPLRSWNVVESSYNRLRKRGGGVGGLGIKAHRVGQGMRQARDLDDLHRLIASIWLHPESLIADGGSEPAGSFDDSLPTIGVDDPAARMMFQDMRSYLPDDILCKVDRAAMSVSLETRMPFLDPEVIALAARLPVSMKIRNGRGKWALRQVLYRYVPAELINRPKAGFAIPVGQWLRGPLRDWAESLLATERLAADGLLNPTPIRRAWKEHLSGKRDWTPRLWAILMLQAWREGQE